MATLLFALTAVAQKAPAAEHHAHLQSEAAARLLNESSSRQGGEAEVPHTARDLIAALDAAGIARSVVLSDAYRFGAPWVTIPDEAARVDSENAWTADQAVLYPKRLMAFCSVSPLKPYAAAAIRHCYEHGMRGLKLHLANAGFHFDKPEDVRALAAVFRQANRLGMAILIHLRTAERWDAPGAMRLFMRVVLPEAPDVTVQVAHLAGWGGYDRTTDAGLGALLDQCDADKPVCAHLYFDLAAVVLPASAATLPKGSDERQLFDEQADFPEAAQSMAVKLRRIGLGRVLFATDWPEAAPADYVALLRGQLLLKPNELRRVFANEAPYFEGAGRSR